MIALDIASSGFRGGLWSPNRLLLFDHSKDRKNGDSQAVFIENGWFFDNCIGTNEKKNKNNQVYDIMDICRLVSKNWSEELLERKKSWPFDTSLTDNGDVKMVMKYGDKEHESTLLQLISSVFTYIHRLVTLDLKVTVNSICLLVPGDFGDKESELLRRAAEDANLQRVRLLDERIAAVIPYIYYGGINRLDSTIFLVDFGASSVKLSFISLWKGRIRIRDSKVITTVCGHRIDCLVLKYIKRKYQVFCGHLLLDDITDQDALLNECEKAKIHLTLYSSYDVQLQSLGALRNISFSIKEFEALLQLPLWLLKQEVNQALRRIQWKSESIDSVISIGGNSSIPAVKRVFKELFRYAEHDYSSSIQNPSLLGSELAHEFGKCPIISDHWCYRVRVHDVKYLVVGRSLECLTKDLLLFPIPQPRKGTSTIIRVLVERCKESEYARAMMMPYDMAKNRGVWEYVFGYHYSVSFKPNYTWEETVLPSIGPTNPYTQFTEEEPEILKQECLEVSAQVIEDGRVTVTMAQIHRGRYVYGSWRSFSFLNGRVIEDVSPRRGVIAEHSLFSSRLEAYKQSITPLTTCTSSSVLPVLYSDRTQSPILLIDPQESNIVLAGDQNPFVIHCPNRHLWSRNLPFLINTHREMTVSSSQIRSILSKVSVKDTLQFQSTDLPQFQQAPRIPTTNRRLFFHGPEPDVSPISVCCFVGTLIKGVPNGKGMEYSVSHETVYQGMWLDGRYEGSGTLWREDGYRLEGIFIKGLLNGEGTIFHSDGSVRYCGGFISGDKHGNGIDYDEDGSEYHGEFIKGKRDGKGILMKSDQILYEGNWRNDLKHGRGHEIIEQTSYEGEFRQGYREGKGKLCRIDGQLIYAGEWKQGKRQGKGKEIFKTDIIYEGDFMNDVCEGQGKQIVDGVLLYEGLFSNGLREGYGHVYNSDGSIAMEGNFTQGRLRGECTIYHGSTDCFFMGNVVDDIPNGKGTEMFATGSYYEGNFVNGLRHGQGRWYNDTKALEYTGTWVYGYKHGSGEFQDDRGLYVGGFIKEIMCGYGKLTYFSGDLYIGEFSDNHPNGRGKYINANGKVTYEGEWRDGKRNGMGKIFFGNGEYYHGLFYNDVMCGRGIYYYENGIPQYVGEFRNDMRNGEGIEYDINSDIMERGFYVNNKCIINTIL